MSEIIGRYGAEIIVSLLSLIAVGVSLFRAQAQETEAAARAVTELAEASQDLRTRINALEVDNRRKDEMLGALRQRSAHLPVLEAQVAQLTEELAQVRQQSERVQARLEGDLQQKQAQLEQLREGEPR